MSQRPLRCQESCTRCPFEAGIPRVYTLRKLDERRNLEQGLDDKIDSVRRRLREDRADCPPGD